LFLFAFSSCKKCVQCEIRLKESQEVIGFIDEFCGNDKKVEEEQERLRAEYSCVDCTIETTFGPVSTGIHCGNRAFTDSIKSDANASATNLGTSTSCVLYRDTANVTCVLK